MDDNKVLLEELRNIYQISFQQITFTESKNGALIVFNAAMLTIFLSNATLLNFAQVIYSAGLMVSCLIGFASFAPLSYRYDSKSQIDDWNSSLIYFRNIAKYDGRQWERYVKDLCKSLNVPYIHQDNSLVGGYAQEIIVLSKITAIKNSFFRVALLITVISIVVFSCSFLICLSV